MRSRLPLAVAVLAWAAAPAAHAEKVPTEFRTAFERTFAAGRTYGVVMKQGLPTTSIYGVEGNQTAAHYSIDVKDGQWTTAQGLLDTDQTAADFLKKGEVVELKSISWKDNRVDLRFESTEAHKVTRGAAFLSDTKREPVATNFKFFFPFTVTGAKDAPRAVAYVEKYVKAFSTEQQARTFARGGGGGSQAAAGGGGSKPAASKPVATKKQEIKAGMTALQVIDVLGKPQKETTFGAKAKWTYADLTVLFENGRVTEVEF
jgi:hypothetical protein